MLRNLLLVTLVLPFQIAFADSVSMPYAAQAGDRVLHAGDNGYGGWSSFSILTNFQCDVKDEYVYLAGRGGQFTVQVPQKPAVIYRNEAVTVPDDKNVPSHNPYQYNTFFFSTVGTADDGSQAVVESFLGMRLHSDIFLIWTRPSSSAPWKFWTKCVER